MKTIQLFLFLYKQHLILQFEMKFQENKQNLLRYYHDKTLYELEQQLKKLKQKQNQYKKLNLRVKDLQQKSKKIKKTTQDMSNQQDDSKVIDKLKKDIDRTLAEIKRIDDDNRLIKQQNKSLQNQLKGLEQIHNTLCNQNKNRRHRIQIKDENLVIKQNQLAELMQKRDQNQDNINQMRLQISRLQNQQDSLKRQLECMRLERQEQQKQKQRLRLLVMQLKREINQQQYNSQEFKTKLSEVKQANYLLQEELILLIKMEQKLKEQLVKSSEQYHTISKIQPQSRKKVQALRDQLFIVEQDVKKLTHQYIRENELLRAQQRKNQEINHQIDNVTKEVQQVWSNIQEITAINQDKTQIKTKAYRIWIEISQILSKE